MFKWFTWSKLAGWAAIAGGVLASPLVGGLVGAALAAKLVGIGALLAGFSSLITTRAAGNATDVNNVPLNQGGGK